VSLTVLMMTRVPEALRRLAVCPGCQTCFGASSPRCPGCGRDDQVPLSLVVKRKALHLTGPN
jgi:hypothetical protein